VIVDPDSRLTQLGLLPLCDAKGYYFFPSREYSSGNNASLGQLASHWSASVFGGKGKADPTISPARHDIDLGKRIVGLLGRQGRRPVVTVNFGIGENPKKRAGRDFEESVISSLIQKELRVVLDRGASEEESLRIDAVLGRVCGDASGIRVLDIDERSVSQAEGEADIVVWNGRIGVLAGSIANSDLYIGYDSAGQHIAAALGVPCIDVFAGYSSPKMLKRWKPTGRAETVVVDGEDRNPADVANEVAIVTRRMVKR
ncbi:MAG: glycosyltransferase family 9 protein, partial [Blastocatellia bacterium]